MEQLVFGIGVALGAGALLTVYYVWVKRQTFGIGGSLLSVTGIVLVGLPLWSSINLSVSATGLRAELERMQERVEEVAEASAIVSETVVDLAEMQDSSHRQFTQLTEVLERRQAFDSAELTEIQGIAIRPMVDRATLDRATRVLRQPREDSLRPPND